MANVNCEACEEIRQVDPNLIVNGFGDTECASLKNNTGLSPSSGNDDCTDLKATKKQNSICTRSVIGRSL